MLGVLCYGKLRFGEAGELRCGRLSTALVGFVGFR